MARQYWLQREGKTYGPYSGGELKKLAREGNIGPNDHISVDKRTWQVAGTVRGLPLCTTVDPQQPASAVIAPPPMEVAPRAGTASRIHNQRPSSSKYERQFPPRSSSTKWIAIGVAGVFMVGLVVAIIVWRWTPPSESTASKELAQSDKNVQPGGRSPRKSMPVAKPMEKPRPIAKPKLVVRPVVKPKPVAKPATVSPEAYCNMAIAYYTEGKHQEAIAAYKKAIAVKPDHAKAYYNMGVIYDDLKRYTDAIIAYKKAIAIKPDYARAYYNMGWACEMLKQYRAAIAAYKKAIAIKPDFARAYYNIGVVYGKHEQYQDAIGAFKKCVAIDPDLAVAHFKMGFTYYLSNRPREAIGAFRKSLALEPTAEWSGAARRFIKALSNR